MYNTLVVGSCDFHAVAHTCSSEGYIQRTVVNTILNDSAVLPSVLEVTKCQTRCHILQLRFSQIQSQCC